MPWPGKWNISIFQSAILMELFTLRFSSLTTHLATYHHPISILEAASAFPIWHSEILDWGWWNHVSWWISSLEISGHNCMAAYTRPPFGTQLYKSWYWRSGAQWTQKQCSWRICCSAPWAVCIQHWQSSIQRSATWTMNLLPMSRRLNRGCPVGEIGNAPAKPGAILPQDQLPLFRNYSDKIYDDTVNDLSDHTDCCGSECKLLHLGSCFFNSSSVSAVDSCL